MYDNGRTPGQHIEQAERYAAVLEKALVNSAAKDIRLLAVDLQAHDLFLRAAEVHLRLAEAKRTHVTDVKYQADYG